MKRLLTVAGMRLPLCARAAHICAKVTRASLTDANMKIREEK